MDEIEKIINYLFTGYKVSPDDYRTINSNQIAPSKPVSFKTIDPQIIGGIMMQNKQPSCTDYAVVYAMKLYWFEKTGQVINFNPAFLRKMYAKTYGVGPEDGTDLMLTLKLAAQYGCATFMTVPDVSTDTPENYQAYTVTQEALNEAIQYKIPGFVKVNLTAPDFKNEIEKYGLIMVCSDLGKEWYTNSEGIIDWSAQGICPLRSISEIISGHSYALTGSVEGDDYFTVLNEWSPAWANNGQNLLKFSEYSHDFMEAFAISEVPQEFISMVKNLPAEKEFKHTFNINLMPGTSDTEEVKALQIALMIEGVLTLDPSINLGFYGPMTTNAVKALQTANSAAILTPVGETIATGIVGPSTRDWLNSKFGI